MKKKQFKTESKKLLDMMINSIYTHKEIFLRELISNASDALDKLYFRSLTDESVVQSRADYKIEINANKNARTLTISDNGCGMSAEELENNLGTIARSGSFDFKNENTADEVDIIGQFGVGFYSAFMVADKITVYSKPYGEETGHVWESSGLDGYSISDAEVKNSGTTIVLQIKVDTEDENYSDFLEEYKIRSLVKKYSDYIRYPIMMPVTKSRKKSEDGDEYEEYTEIETLNSMIPIWKKSASEVSEDEYASFYRDRFYDYEKPARVITQKSEGNATYNALLFVPQHAPYNYYTKEYEKGLELYSSGVLIMEKCSELLPDYFGFVKGLVDSADLSLNISRETLQHDRQLKIIAKAIEKKIKGELEKMLASDRSKYEKLFDEFGIQLKFGVYSDYGMHKDTLQDLLMFHTSNEGKYATLKEYTAAMKDEQKFIYYATGESIAKIEMLPQVDAVRSLGYEVLYLTDEVDEFALKVLGKYDEKEFKNVTAEALDIASEEQKELATKANDENKELLDFIKESVEKISSARFTASLSKHPACLSSEGELSLGMEKVLSKMPGGSGAPKAQLVMEINLNHPIFEKLKSLFESDKDTLKKYAKLLYHESCLIAGVTPEDTGEFCTLISELMLK